MWKRCPRCWMMKKHRAVDGGQHLYISCFPAAFGEIPLHSEPKILGTRPVFVDVCSDNKKRYVERCTQAKVTGRHFDASSSGLCQTVGHQDPNYLPCFMSPNTLKAGKKHNLTLLFHCTLDKFLFTITCEIN